MATYPGTASPSVGIIRFIERPRGKKSGHKMDQKGVTTKGRTEKRRKKYSERLRPNSIFSIPVFLSDPSSQIRHSRNSGILFRVRLDHSAGFAVSSFPSLPLFV